jgi:hypothetical protein
MGKTIQKIDFTVPIRTVSEMNSRDHWTVRQKRKKAQQEEMLVALYNNLKSHRITQPIAITLTRMGPRRLDGDNLQSSLKFCRDAIAWKIGIDDGNEKAALWFYSQTMAKTFGVRVQIESMDTSRANTSPE